MALLRRFQPILPRSSQLTIYKTFIRIQLDFADIIYDQACNSPFHEKIESIQHNACLTMTGVIRGTSAENSPSYLFDLIPNLNRLLETRHSNNIPTIHTRHNYFKNSFFPSTISEWNNLDCKIRNSGNLSIFKKNLLNFIRPCANSIFNIHNPYGIKLLTRLQLGLSHLRDHKFRHCF